MTPSNPLGRIARFGVFDLDPRTGDLVTHDDLRRRLWSDAVFVDVEQGLNNAIAKIRLALGDSAQSPRFVETTKRRGYRFIAIVEWVAIGLQAPWPQCASPP